MSDKYNEFKHLLKRFVEQANINIKGSSDRSPHLSPDSFEKDNYKLESSKNMKIDKVRIDDKWFDIHLKSGSSYGPTKKESSTVPYIDYYIDNNLWANLRFTFNSKAIDKVSIVIWDSNKVDHKTGIEAKINDFDLDNENAPNDALISFFDQYMNIKESKIYRTLISKNYNIIEEPQPSYNDSKYARVLRQSKNLILRGAPGTGKTYLAKQIAEELTGGNDDQIGFVQFHPSYDYTDFVEGLRPVSSADGQIGFELQDGIFKEFCTKAKENSSKDFVFIIDEINRGEISKIFGELFFAIDPSYRGEKGAVSTQYANLHETDEKFYIPENVYIIGTMNDIDRSVDTFDFAMRRRFRFVEVTAEDQLSMLDKLGDNAEGAKARLTNLNSAISKADGLNSHYHIGPSYFLKLADIDYDYEVLWSDYLQPLLEDYLRGSYDEVEKLKELEKAYNSAEKEESDETDG